jgi:hypothetical protein
MKRTLISILILAVALLTISGGRTAFVQAAGGIGTLNDPAAPQTQKSDEKR